MEKPFLKLTTKDFLTGIAPSAHSVTGGLFFKAKGVTALSNPGQTEATDNGLLRAGPGSTDLTQSVVVDTIQASVKDYTSGGSVILYLMGAAGHFYKLLTNDTISDLRSGTPITSPLNGLAEFQAVGGTKYIYYSQAAKIGRWDISGTYPTGWTDNYIGSGGTINHTLQTTVTRPMHTFGSKLYYGNGYLLGKIYDVGGVVTDNQATFTIPQNMIISAISNDGTYLALAVTENTQLLAGAFSDTRVAFWDEASSNWIRYYNIPDPYIQSLTRFGNSVIAQGYYGVYEVNFSEGVRKIRSGLSSSYQLGVQAAGIYNQAYMYGHGDGGAGTVPCVAHFGKMADDAPRAYIEPIATDNGKSVSLIETQFQSGRVYVATSTPKLYRYNFVTATTGQTAVTAQTVYFPIPQKINIKRIDIIFGQPLASGDSLLVEVYKDEYTAQTTFGTATFAIDGATRRKSIFNNVIADEQFSLALTFTAGLVKIKAIEVYGDAMNA